MVGTPANSLNLTTAGIVKFDGASVFSGQAVTNHAILVGAAANGIGSVGPGTTNTVLLGNTGSDPTFGAVPAGALPGSGQITLSDGTNVSVTGSPVSLGGTATINVSGPPSATTLTNHGVVIGQGTSAVAATAAGSSGQVLQSGGASANPAYSTATYPSIATSSGTIIRADGTNWAATTATYPATTTANQILYSSATNTVTGLPSAASSVVVTDGSSVPSLSQTLPSAVQGNITTVGTISSGTWNGSTIDVAHGGTGRTTLTNHGVLVGATTSAITQLAAGTAGQVLQSGGASADPAYSTATYPSTAGSSGKILISDGTNIVSSTPTYPNASASTGKFIISDGTNFIASTPTIPNTAGTSGKILVSDGTNFISSTPTFPNASATSRKMIVSDGTNWVASTETWAVPGTSGNVLTSNGTNWTSAAASGGILLTVSRTLTNSEIKNIRGTPIEIIAAPGSGKGIVIVNACSKLVYGGNNAFVAGGSSSISLRYNNNVTSVLVIVDQTMISAAASQFKLATSTISSFAVAGVFDNVNIAAFNTGSQEISGNANNDNTINISITYWIVTF